MTTWRDWTEEQWVAVDYVVGAYTENIEEEVGTDISDEDEVPAGLVARMMDVFDYDQLRAFAYDLHEASYNHDSEAFADRMENYAGAEWITDAAWVFLNPCIEGIDFLGEHCITLLTALAVAGIEVES